MCTSSWIGRKKRTFRDCKLWSLGDISPAHFKELSDPASRKSARSAAPMHFYCQMPKKGLLKSHTTVVAYRDFSVNPRWIGGYLQQGKLSVEAAHKESPRCAPVAHGTFWGFLNHMPPPGSPGGWIGGGGPPPSTPPFGPRCCPYV